jgi:uncharacterized protein DUF992
MFKCSLSAITALVLVFSSATAQEARVDIGLLTCGLDEGANGESRGDTIAGDPKKMLCVYRPSNSGPEEVYAGAFQTIGQEQQSTHDQAMIWVVRAPPTTQRSIGLLQQIYAADRAAPSTHPPPLIGETNSAIMLQTLADAQALNSVDKQSAVAIIVLVSLKLLSSPA